METALKQYVKKRTIIVQTRENIPLLESPVFVICTNPPFKPTFSEINGVGEAQLL